jgi:predicted nucleic acid-binding protein
VIVIDTNVVAELMRAQPHPKVFAWVAAQPRVTLYTTSVTQAEILYGIAALPEGRRRTALAAAADAMFTEDFADRVLPFNRAAAAHYAEIVTTRQRAGSPIEAFDALIAATAQAVGADIATRDIGGFEGCSLTLINPWEAS